MRDIIVAVVVVVVVAIVPFFFKYQAGEGINKQAGSERTNAGGMAWASVDECESRELCTPETAEKLV